MTFPFINVDVNQMRFEETEFQQEDKGDQTYAAVFPDITVRDATIGGYVNGLDTGVADPSENASQVDGVIPNIPNA